MQCAPMKVRSLKEKADVFAGWLKLQVRKLMIANMISALFPES